MNDAQDTAACPVFKDAVWQILVQECDASSWWHEEFMQHWPECREFRFQGALGFGGKVYSDPGRVYVTCYPEDKTAQRKRRIAVANARLAALLSAMVAAGVVADGNGSAQDGRSAVIVPCTDMPNDPVGSTPVITDGPAS